MTQGSSPQDLQLLMKEDTHGTFALHIPRPFDEIEFTVELQQCGIESSGSAVDLKK